MTIMGVARPAAVLLLILGLAACAQRPVGTPPPTDAAPPPSAELPADAAALVVRVEYVGGFVTPETTVSRIPSYSLYADGRLITNGPIAAIHPAFALPNLQVQVLDEVTVRDLANRALAAGVAETTDLGSPPIADMPSTRFTLTTADGTFVREVSALSDHVFEGDQSEAELTDEQRAGRAKLRELLTALSDLGQQLTPEGQAPFDRYVAESVAAIVRPWTAPEEDVAHGMTPEPVPWPGPALPGEPIGPLPDLGCVVATGDQATAVIAAARDANVLTPWLSPDDTRWSVTFRPLLPDESGCADLLD
jgi:hypothetical protein